MVRPAYIVIHGHGSSLRDSLELLSEIESIPCQWRDGIFYMHKSKGSLIRKIFAEGHDAGPLVRALQKIAISSMLESSISSDSISSREKGAYISFNELRLLEQFSDLAIPIGPNSRKKRSVRLRKEGIEELLGCFSAKGKFSDIGELRKSLISLTRRSDGELLSESEMESVLAEYSSSEKVLEDLKALRDMGESGADLDTISSAVFYAHGLKSMMEAQGKEFRHGIHYKFVFFNYFDDDSLAGVELGDDRPGDVYCADIPVTKMPSPKKGMKFLRKHNLTLLRYEDHHPYTEKQLNTLEKLRQRGVIAYYSMSGPVEGTELPEDELKCGGDMVYDALIKGKSWETPAMAFLDRCVHSEDLGKCVEPVGKVLTELIKGGVNSLDLAQTLLLCHEEGDIEKRLAEKGWLDRIRKERDEVAKIAPRILNNAYIFELEQKNVVTAESGPALADGSDMPAPLSQRTKDAGALRIAVALAPSTKRGEPKLKIGRACEFFNRNMNEGKIPRSDYLLYCYGSSLMVSRRLNQAETSVNLATLMKKIGTESDGGHAGAAVSNPASNPNYPSSILGQVNVGNFSMYTRYISGIISESLDTKVKRRSISVIEVQERHSQGSRNLMYLILATLLLGLAIIVFNKNYRTAAIAEQNSKYFSWLDRDKEDAKPESVEAEGVADTDSEPSPDKQKEGEPE